MCCMKKDQRSELVMLIYNELVRYCLREIYTGTGAVTVFKLSRHLYRLNVTWLLEKPGYTANQGTCLHALW